jgi:FAD/FMN-containing dehydrogenase
MTTTLPTPTRIPTPRSLRDLCGGAVHLPGDPAYDASRGAWNAAVDQRPAAVAYPADTAEVAAVVRAAAAAGLRVAAQGTGHNAGPLGDLSTTVLLRTSAMTGARIDLAAERATVRAGTLWLEAVTAATEAGTGVLHGSSPDVGVVGYSLGGGMGWYARTHGLQTNSITGAEVVLADGSVVRTDADHEPDLFWALRGGGGNFGVVTELEFRTYPITEAYAGLMIWDWERVAEVLPRWAEWAVTAPDAVTTSFRILQVPPLPTVPEPVRGRSVVMIDGAVLADDEVAEAILAPLRALRPEIDTFRRVPASSLVRLHMDPEGPTPGVSATTMLGELPPAAIDAFIAAAGPGSGSVLLAAELRQLGGALGRPAEGAGALPSLDAQFLLFGVAIAPDPDLARIGRGHAERLVSALTPWGAGRQYLNFVEEPIDAANGYRPENWTRLRAIRDAVDPDGVFHANHPVPRTR